MSELDEISRNGDHDASRRKVLRAAAAMAALAATGGSGTAFSQTGNFDWKRYKGEKIEVSLVKNPRADVLQKYQKEFEDLTGIVVAFESVPEQQHRPKQVIEFNSGAPSFDVTTISYHVQKRMAGKGQWLADLRPMLSDKSLTWPDFDYDDFTPGALLFAKQADGRVDALPLSLDYFMIYWNKELFASKGLPYPRSYGELIDSAAKLNDPARRQFGVVARGMRNANTYVWNSLMLGWGEDALKTNGELNTDGPAAIAAAEMYTTLCRDYSPPGTIGYNWNECQATFSQGGVAMWPDSIGFAPPLEDPMKSKIVGRVGYGVVPAGPKAHASGLTGDGIGVVALSKRKGSAYFYVQWATSKQNQARFLQTGAGAGARTSLYGDPKVLAEVKAPKDWVDCVMGSARIGRPTFPSIIPVGEFRDTFGIALANMIAGADPATELRKATEVFKPILEKSEKG